MAKRAEERAREAALIAEEEEKNSQDSARSREGGSMTGHAAPTRYVCAFVRGRKNERESIESSPEVQ